MKLWKIYILPLEQRNIPRRTAPGNIPRSTVKYLDFAIMAENNWCKVINLIHNMSLFYSFKTITTCKKSDICLQLPFYTRDRYHQLGAGWTLLDCIVGCRCLQWVLVLCLLVPLCDYCWKALTMMCFADVQLIIASVFHGLLVIGIM